MSKEHKILSMICLAALLALAWATSPYGLGVTPDSVYYLSAARNLAGGKSLRSDDFRWYSKSFTRPFDRWPPLYPLAIAGIASLGFDVQQAAWLLHLCLLAVNAFLLGNLLGKIPASKLTPLVGALLFVVLYPTYQVHATVCSEPLFIALLLSAITLFLHFLNTDQLFWLAFSGLAAGASYLTRYVGLTLILTLALVLFFASRQTLKRRLYASAIFLLSSAALPLILLGSRFQYALLGREEPSVDELRYFRIHQDLWRVLQTLANWLFPSLGANLATLVLLGILLILAVPFWLRKHQKQEKLRYYLGTWILFSCIYSLFILFSCYFHDATLLKKHNADRYLFILLPALISIVASAISLTADWWSQYVNRKLFLILLTLLFLPLCSQKISWMKMIRHKGGGNYTDKKWQENSCLEWLRSAKLKRVLFSPDCEVLSMLTEYKVRNIPRQRENNGLRLFWNFVARDNGLLVFLDPPPSPDYISEAEFLATKKLTPIFTFADGRIYELKAE